MKCYVCEKRESEIDPVTGEDTHWCRKCARDYAKSVIKTIKANKR